MAPTWAGPGLFCLLIRSQISFLESFQSLRSQFLSRTLHLIAESAFL